MAGRRDRPRDEDPLLCPACETLFLYGEGCPTPACRKRLRLASGLPFRDRPPDVPIAPLPPLTDLLQPPAHAPSLTVPAVPRAPPPSAEVTNAVISAPSPLPPLPPLLPSPPPAPPLRTTGDPLPAAAASAAALALLPLLPAPPPPAAHSGPGRRRMTVEDRIEQAQWFGASEEEMEECGTDLQALQRLINRLGKRERSESHNSRVRAQYNPRARAERHDPRAASAEYERTRKFVFTKDELKDREAFRKAGTVARSASVKSCSSLE